MYISDTVIRKMLKDAGASRISKEACDELKKYIERTAFEVAKNSVKLAQHANRKTVDASDVKLATG